jgi:hypothetical protein
MKTRNALKLFVIVLTLLPFVVQAAEEQSGVKYMRIYTDANGESHFDDGEFPFDFLDLPTGERAGVHSLALDGAATFMMIAPGAFEDWHPAPTTQTLVVIQGEVEVGVSDGEVRRMTPGMVLVMEDNSGKGHTTRTIGDIPHIAMMLPRPVQ